MQSQELFQLLNTYRMLLILVFFVSFKQPTNQDLPSSYDSLAFILPSTAQADFYVLL